MLIAGCGVTPYPAYGLHVFLGRISAAPSGKKTHITFSSA
jgi:hypothetical protein